jgi:hypothetical protein
MISEDVRSFAPIVGPYTDEGGPGGGVAAGTVEDAAGAAAGTVTTSELATGVTAG